MLMQEDCCVMQGIPGDHGNDGMPGERGEMVTMDVKHTVHTSVIGSMGILIYSKSSPLSVLVPKAVDLMIPFVSQGSPGPKGVPGRAGTCGRDGSNGLDGQSGPPGHPGLKVRLER